MRYVITILLIIIPLSAFAQIIYFSNGATLEVRSAKVENNYVSVTGMDGGVSYYNLNDVNIAASGLKTTGAYSKDQPASMDIEGFRDYKWGAPPERLGLIAKVYEESGLVGYNAPHESNKFGDAEADSIIFMFYKDELAMVIISFTGRSNYAYLKTALEGKYGAEDSSETYADHYIWNRTAGSVDLKFSDITLDGTISIFSREQYGRWMSDKSSSAATEGASDF